MSLKSIFKATLDLASLTQKQLKSDWLSATSRVFMFSPVSTTPLFSALTLLLFERVQDVKRYWGKMVMCWQTFSGARASEARVVRATC